MSKSRPGVCGTCGTAVVQPDVEGRRAGTWCVPPGTERSFELPASFGHMYGADGELMKVRCARCAHFDGHKPLRRADGWWM